MLDVLESDIGQGTLGGVDPDTLDLRRSNQWYRFADFFPPPFYHIFPAPFFLVRAQPARQTAIGF